MNPRKLAIVLSLLASTSTGAMVGCAAETAPPQMQMENIPDGARLELVGSSSRVLAANSEEEIEVRYLTLQGEPIEGTISFAIEGDAAGGSLSGMLVRSDASGSAKLNLRTGNDATFSVVANGLNTDPVRVNVTVQPLQFRDLSYRVGYVGARDISQVEVGLFTNITCAGVEASPPTASQSQNTSLNRNEAFQNVEMNVPVALYAIGIDGRNNVATVACQDVRLSATTPQVQLVMADTAYQFGGTYGTRETFNVTEGFNPNLDFALDAIDGISTDAAAYITNFAATDDRSPSWLRTALGVPGVSSLVTTEIRNALSNIHSPAWLSDVGNLGSDVNRAFSAMSLNGELTFGQPAEFTTTGTHTIRSVEIPVDGIAITSPVTASATLQVQVGNQIMMSEHSLNVSFGTLALMILNDILLPRLPGAPHSVTELLNNLLDCDALATRITSSDSSIRDAIAGVCMIGETIVGTMVSDKIVGLVNYDQLHLSGHAELVDADRDYDTETIRNGVAAARWTGSSGEMDFTGTFTGSLLSDPSNHGNAIRTRIENTLQ